MLPPGPRSLHRAASDARDASALVTQDHEDEQREAAPCKKTAAVGQEIQCRPSTETSWPSCCQIMA